MGKRTAAISVSLTAAVVTALWLTAPPVTAQGGTQAYKAPRTADGKPDLSGYWTNLSFTPVERPQQFADKAFFTEAEAKAFFAKAVQDDFNRELEGNVHYDPTDYGMDKWQNDVKLNLRTSLITSPANGRIPLLTPEAQARIAAVKAAAGPGGFRGGTAGPEDRSLFERCIRGTQGPPMLPGPFDNEIQIVQTAQHVMLLAQSMNDVRIIPLDGRPHVPQNVRLLLGDSRGRWEGDTLVVDTTNFSDQTLFRASTRNLHLVERFTRTGPDVIKYEATVNDPATWTAPWSFEVPLNRAGRVYEFACHENNLAMINTLSGARQDEKDRAAGAAQGGNQK